MKALLSVAAMLCLAGCTFGAPGTAAAGGAQANDVTIDVNLTLHQATTIAPNSESVGYAPAVTLVATNTRVRFVNSDSFAHTATAIVDPAFPAVSPFIQSDLTARGTSLSAGFSSGNFAAGAASPEFTADLPGTYRFGCFYHYGADMRGEIIVQ